MADIRHEANDAAQRAWTRLREHHSRTQRWHPILEREYLLAEQMVRDIEAFEAMPEHLLDALHEAMTDDLADRAELEDGLPDIPLALAVPMEWTRIEDVSPQLAAYWNRGA